MVDALDYSLFLLIYTAGVGRAQFSLLPCCRRGHLRPSGSTQQSIMLSAAFASRSTQPHLMQFFTPRAVTQEILPFTLVVTRVMLRNWRPHLLHTELVRNSDTSVTSVNCRRAALYVAVCGYGLRKGALAAHLPSPYAISQFGPASVLTRCSAVSMTRRFERVRR